MTLDEPTKMTLVDLPFKWRFVYAFIVAAFCLILIPVAIVICLFCAAWAPFVCFFWPEKITVKHRTLH